MDTSLWVVFLTGLTAGGLSCMAVQGGLVTASLASQLESDLSKPAQKRKGSKNNNLRIALSINLFLFSKIVAYTLYGAALGALGSVFSLTPVMRGYLQIFIAIFMIGNALRLLNVHPIFRYFNIEPPASLRRWIRQKSKNQDAWFSPVFLGALTILIPCGITQAMLALAIATGDPLQGAMIMFAFTLGASPVFFALTYLATRLGTLMEKYFLRFVALVLFIFAFISLDSGLNLIGFPYTISRARNMNKGDSSLAISNPVEPEQYGVGTSPIKEGDVVIQVKTAGYFPYESVAPAGQPIRLRLVTNDTYSCARAFTIPSLDIQVLLDASGEKIVELPPQESGTVLNYTCSMGMYSGVIKFL